MQNIMQYINIILTIISIAIALLAVYTKVKSNIIEAIIKFIKEAETKELSGAEKMQLVISWIKDVTPRLFQLIFTDAILKEIAQNIYNDMKEYRDNYIRSNKDALLKQITLLESNNK